MKFEIWQFQPTGEVERILNSGAVVRRLNSLQVARLVRQGEIGVEEWREYCDIKILGTSKAVQNALDSGKYTHVANIEANDPEEVFEIGNIGPEDRIERLGQMQPIAIGDVVIGKVTLVRKKFGWGGIKGFGRKSEILHRGTR